MALALDDWWCNRLLDVILLFNNTEVVDEFREVLDFVEAGLKDPDNSRCDHYLLQPTYLPYAKKVKMLNGSKFLNLAEYHGFKETCLDQGGRGHLNSRGAR